MRFRSDTDFAETVGETQKIRKIKVHSSVLLGEHPFQRMLVFEEIGNGQPVLVITAPPVFQFVIGADHKDAFAEFAVQRKRKFRNAVLIRRER